MQRGQMIAAVVVAVVLGGLLIVRFGPGGNLDGDLSTAAGGIPSGAGRSDNAPTSTPSPSTAGPSATPRVIADAPDRLGPARGLSDLDGWLQTEATSFDDFDGQVRIVQFWTFGCYNCRNTIPHLEGIYARWQPEGLEIIGVHAPEFDFERDPEAVAAAAVEHGVSWPIALDTEKRNFRAWQTGRRFWPRTFVVDQAGEIRFDHIGEGSYDELEATVAFLVENGP